MHQIRHLLQGEAFNTVDPELVVRALVGKGRHIHEKELSLRGGTGWRLAQCTGHMVVRVLPLVAGDTEGGREVDKQKERKNLRAQCDD